MILINGQRYEAEPAVEAYVKDLQAENEEQRREILRLTDELKEMDGANEYLRNQSAKDFENVLKFMDTIGALKKENERLEEKYQKATGVIAMYPSVNAEPVKHGEWIKTDVCENQFKCSECGRTVTTNTSIVDPADFEFYCYNCGARMDLKDGESK